MPSKVYSAAVVGVDAFEVEIEVHAGWGPEGEDQCSGFAGYGGKREPRSGPERAEQQRDADAPRENYH